MSGAPYMAASLERSCGAKQLWKIVVSWERLQGGLFVHKIRESNSPPKWSEITFGFAQCRLFVVFATKDDILSKVMSDLGILPLKLSS